MFLSLDPEGDGYHYAADNPANFTDPSGLCLSKDGLAKFDAKIEAMIAKLNGKLADYVRRAWSGTMESASSLGCGAEAATESAGGGTTAQPSGGTSSGTGSSGSGSTDGTSGYGLGAGSNTLSAMADGPTTLCDIWAEWHELSGGAYTLQAFAECSPSVRIVTVYVTIMRMTMPGGRPRFEMITAHAICLGAGVLDCAGIPRLIPPGKLRKGSSYTVIITGFCAPGCAPHVPVRRRVRF